MKTKILTMLILAFLLSLFGCNNTQKSEKKEKSGTYEKTMPEWAKDAVIYEVNIRQHTPEGTFDAFAKDIPRLKELGVDILWIMPIQEIGVKNRKGGMGSYYSIKNYTKTNPEFGSLDDFRNLVKTAHDNGMYVILDWVANHTAWDHVWTETHPEFYTKDSLGNFIPPVADWGDVIDLNYDNQELHTAMINDMAFWINETDIDGFRCDVAEMVPTEFWNESREALDKIKPVFMLAEAEQAEHHDSAFDMSYSWWLLHGMNQIAKGEKNVTELDTILNWEMKNFPEGSVKMRFTTNHDENSWNGTVFERYGEGNLCFSVLCYTLPGMPLLYSGQEAGLDHRLSFFEKDSIDWSNIIYEDFYKSLNKLKKDNIALWNGSYGGDFKIIHSSKKSPFFAYTRTKDENNILVILNLSPNEAETKIKSEKNTTYKDYFTNKEYSKTELNSLKMKPWEYLILIKQ
ncbi:MAG: alpha-glucosidase C-terminal domain-containing protein [Bacteroidales bacterium]|nr:alpha-glucosidase C-terminal domain-containing protein [Bacteroidales bacterium]